MERVMSGKQVFERGVATTSSIKLYKRRIKKRAKQDKADARKKLSSDNLTRPMVTMVKVGDDVGTFDVFECHGITIRMENNNTTMVIIIHNNRDDPLEVA